MSELQELEARLDIAEANIRRLEDELSKLRNKNSVETSLIQNQCLQELVKLYGNIYIMKENFND